MWSRLRALVLFNAAYLVVAGAWVLHIGDYEFLAYIAFLLVLAGVVLHVHRRIELPLGLLWCLSAWGGLHMAGGLVHLPQHWPVGDRSPVLYNLWLAGPWLKYDHVVHAFGFGVTTWLCWRALRSMQPQGLAGGPPTAGMLTLCAAAGMGFGALNEVVEFGVTLAVPDNNVGGYLNTALDLVYNAVGAVLAALAIRRFSGGA